jgi:hypothetical protein
MGAIQARTSAATVTADSYAGSRRLSSAAPFLKRQRLLALEQTNQEIGVVSVIRELAEYGPLLRHAELHAPACDSDGVSDVLGAYPKPAGNYPPQFVGVRFTTPTVSHG